MTQLSITSDYCTDDGSPQPYLKRIAEAGFTHTHWCHEWCTDHLYTPSEIKQAQRWLEEYGLKLLNLHGSNGVKKNWSSILENERQAGVELVENRIRMTAELGGDVVIMHTGSPAQGQETAFWRQLRRSLDELEPVTRQAGVRIAVENGGWAIIASLIKEYPPDYVGICYDCGHGNYGDGNLELLDASKERLIAIHLHDNNGRSDQHNLPFTGTVDWEKLAGIIAASSYSKCVNLESCMKESGIRDESEFLARAFESGLRISQMVETAKIALRQTGGAG